MNSTLKPHLLVEVMGLQRQQLPPEELCMLFLSYRDFPEAFALAFRYRCKVRPRGLPHSKFWIQTPYRHGMIFNFTEKLHIPTLLRIAGRLTRRLEVYVFKQPWMEPFLEGIDENQHMEFIHFRAGIHFLKRYLRHHDNHLPTLECNRFSLLDELGDAYIDTLIVSAKPRGKMNKRCRVENIEVDNSVTSTVWDPIVVCGRELKVDPKVLKGLIVRGCIPQDTAYRMLTETCSKLERLELHKVRSKFGSMEYPDLSNHINNDVLLLKTAMHDHPGTVIVHAFYTSYTLASVENRSTVAHICRTTLIGFTVKIENDYPRRMRYILCEFKSNEGNLYVRVEL